MHLHHVLELLLRLDEGDPYLLYPHDIRRRLVMKREIV
jgi:hypothetical protein